LRKKELLNIRMNHLHREAGRSIIFYLIADLNFGVALNNLVALMFAAPFSSSLALAIG
jgi:hypothetical protein